MLLVIAWACIDTLGVCWCELTHREYGLKVDLGWVFGYWNTVGFFEKIFYKWGVYVMDKDETAAMLEWLETVDDKELAKIMDSVDNEYFN